MKKILIFILCVTFSINIFAKRTYWYSYEPYFNTYAIGAGYSNFNEARSVSKIPVSMHQIHMFMVIYGVYIDATIAPSQHTNYTHDIYNFPRSGNWGMSFGYMVPLMKRNSREFRLYVSPAIGFQKSGYWYNYCTGPCYHAPSYHNTITSFQTRASYFDYGGIIAASYKNLWVQFKATRTTLSGSIGFCF